jgi:hypothetical protein
MIFALSRAVRMGEGARKLVILANAILARGTPWQEKRVMP